MNKKQTLSLKKKIFDVNLEIIFPSNAKYKKTLMKELSLYPKHSSEKVIKLYLDTKKSPSKEIVNPSIHSTSESEFGMYGKFLDCTWVKDRTGMKEIIVNTKHKSINPVLKVAYYVFGKDLASFDELLVKNLHEVVFVPTQLLLSNNIILHGSSFSKDKNSGVIMGGTGGCGKTSAMLSLSGSTHYFLSDDMAIVNKKGQILNNYAYPKIYAYNVIGNKKMETKVLSNLPFQSKLLWYCFKIVDPNMVRRRVPPSDLFKVSNVSTKFSNYYILNKSNTSKMSIKKLNAKLASQISWSIIEAEYWDFMNHLRWHEYNCKVNGIKNNFDIEKIKDKYLKNSEQILKKVDVNLIKIPINQTHSNYLKEISKILLN